MFRRREAGMAPEYGPSPMASVQVSGLGRNCGSGSYARRGIGVVKVHRL